MIAPLMLRGEEWRHRDDPDCGMKNAGEWVRKVTHLMRDTPTGNVQYYGARSPQPQTYREAEEMIEYIERLAPVLGGEVVSLLRRPKADG